MQLHEAIRLSRYVQMSILLFRIIFLTWVLIMLLHFLSSFLVSLIYRQKKCLNIFTMEGKNGKMPKSNEFFEKKKCQKFFL